MPTRENKNERASFFKAPWICLILRTLVLGTQHGQGIARSIQRQSDEVFPVDHGSLYLSLQRLEENGLVNGSGAFRTITGGRDSINLLQKGTQPPDE